MLAKAREARISDPLGRDYNSVAAELVNLRPIACAYLAKRFHSLTPTTCEDIVDEVLARLATRDVLDYGVLRPLVFTACRNAAIDYYRSTKSRPETVPLEVAGSTPATETVLDAVVGTELLRRLQTVLDSWRCRPQTRRCYELSLTGRTCPEISETVGCSLSAAKKAVLRGQQFVRAALEPEYG